MTCAILPKNVALQTIWCGTVRCNNINDFQRFLSPNRGNGSSRNGMIRYGCNKINQDRIRQDLMTRIKTKTRLFILVFHFF